jgi:pyridoxal phosphate enzyme (YggS family)
MQDDLRENLVRVAERIAEAAKRAGRAADEIKLIAVSKTHPPEVLREAIRAGARVFGENKVQEAESKIREIGRESCEWHLIGHLQSNKARRAVQLFDVIHTLDSVDLAARLERICAEEKRDDLKVLIQVDLAAEATKSGVSENALPALAEFLESCAHLKFTGLMILPPFYEDVGSVRPFFRRLRELRDELSRKGAFAGGRGELSMGMSHDFETAIEEGATMVRIGTAIFGERNYSAAG